MAKKSLRNDENIEISEINLKDTKLKDIFKDEFIQKMNDEFEDFEIAIIALNLNKEIKPSNLAMLVQVVDSDSEKFSIAIDAKNEENLNKIYNVVTSLE